jgi:hypothetical protein
MTFSLGIDRRCSFSNSVSCHGALTSIDASCLTQCHLGSVSNSCHFFGTPLPIPRRHIQSLRDADQTVRKVPSGDGAIPAAAHAYSASREMNTSSTVHLASPTDTPSTTPSTNSTPNNSRIDYSDKPPHPNAVDPQVSTIPPSAVEIPGRTPSEFVDAARPRYQRGAS